MTVMSREDVFALIRHIGAAALGGREAEPLAIEGTHARPEDVADATAAFSREIAARFDKLPEKFSTDIRAQEMLRAELDRIMGDLALLIERQLNGPDAED